MPCPTTPGPTAFNLGKVEAANATSYALAACFHHQVVGQKTQQRQTEDLFDGIAPNPSLSKAGNSGITITKV